MLNFEFVLLNNINFASKILFWSGKWRFWRDLVQKYNIDKGWISKLLKLAFSSDTTKKINKHFDKLSTDYRFHNREETFKLQFLITMYNGRNNSSDGYEI